ncbi:MAG TPA: AAA family ATPase, partial [Roseiflexaceae bacterium]|nr:AAA family ATPase [Roseiflexaceae bacterium]
SQRRVLAIVGPGGLGKTRLALQAGAEHLEQFPDGVFFVNLADAPSHEWIIAQIAEAVGLGTSNIDPIASTLAALRARTVLLILDNCEHVNGLEAAVTLLTQQVHGLKVIITSRERPALAECAVLELGGLDLPGPSKHDLSLYSSAVQLFVQRARHVQYTFEPDEQEQAAIVQICRLLDGMPLGIELAAAWVAGASCQQIAHMLTTNLRALAASSPDLADRHQRIFAVIDAFWTRLAPAERAMLRPLGLFRGGFDADAAHAVGNVSPFFLSSLVTSGYLRRTSSGRYEMHELLRQYALRQLQAVPRARREAEKRYAQHFTTRVQHSASALLSGGENLAPFRIDLENIMAAWNWAVRRGQIELLRVLGPAMARYWELVGLPHVGEPFLLNAIDCLRANLARLSSEDLALLSHLLCRVMWYQILRDLFVSDRLLEEALKYAHESEFDDAVVETILIHGWYQTRSDPLRARANLERALELGGSPSLNGECRRLLAITYYFTGQFERAAEHYERSVQQFIACGDRLGEMRSTCNLVFLDMERLLYSSCDRRASRLLAQARAIGSTEMECMALAQLCHSSLYRAALERAASYLDRADLSARNNGDPVLEMYCLELRCLLVDLGNRS